MMIIIVECKTLAVAWEMLPEFGCLQHSRLESEPVLSGDSNSLTYMYV